MQPGFGWGKYARCEFANRGLLPECVLARNGPRPISRSDGGDTVGIMSRTRSTIWLARAGVFGSDVFSKYSC